MSPSDFSAESGGLCPSVIAEPLEYLGQDEPAHEGAPDKVLGMLVGYSAIARCGLLSDLRRALADRRGRPLLDRRGRGRLGVDRSRGVRRRVIRLRAWALFG